MTKRSLLNLITGSSPKPEEQSDAETGEEPEQIQVEDNTPNHMAKKQEEQDTEGQLTVDVYQNDDEIVILSTIAGVKASDLDITITSDMVTLEGEREKDDDIDAGDYYYQELYWGPFSRSVILPQEIDTDNAEAKLEDGVLRVVLPKMERSKSKKLKIE